jgi:hypothetical protein
MKKIDKLLTTEQAEKQLDISPRTLNNARNTGTGIVIAYHKIGSRVFYKQSDIEAYKENNTLNHTGEVRGLLDVVTSTKNNTLNHTGEVRGLLDVVTSTKNNTLNHTGEVRGLLDVEYNSLMDK